jgi:hypothetical protein
MTKENRFEGLMGVVGKNRNAQTSKPRNDSDLKSESQAEVHSAHTDVQKPNTKKKRSSEDSAVSVESDCSKKSSSRTNVQSSKSSNISTSNKPNIQTSTTQADNSNSNVSASEHTDVQPSENLNISTSTTKVDNSISNISASKHTDVSTFKKAKSANPDYTRTTVYLPKKMHKKLKAIALDEEREMSSIVEELIETWLSSGT